MSLLDVAATRIANTGVSAEFVGRLISAGNDIPVLLDRINQRPFLAILLIAKDEVMRRFIIATR